MSGVSSTFKNHLKEYVNWSVKKCNLKKDQIVLDVGSNDGTCLKYFQKKKLRVIGIDPAKKPSDIANKNGIKTINDFFTKKRAASIKKKYKKIDYITSHNVLAHIDNLEEVFKNIYFLLKEDGYFCFEVGYFLNVINNIYFDTIYHEHLDYHHASPLARFLKEIGFSIIDIQTNSIQGGTIRILCKKDKLKSVSKKAFRFIDKEKKSVLYNRNYLNSWSNKINKNMQEFSKIIESYLSNGLKVSGYGAPTKLTLLLKTSGLNHSNISYVIEDNLLKIGKYLPQTGIKIRSYEALSLDPPDIIIVFAWNFFLDIIKKLKKDKISNIKIVVPLPKVKVYEL